MGGRGMKNVPLLFLVCATACGSNNNNGSTTAGITVEAPGPGAEVYASTPSPGEPNADVAAGVAAAATEQGIQITHDQRLSTLASWVGREMGERGEPPPHEVVEFFTHHLGLIEPVPHLLVLGMTGSTSNLQGSVRDAVRGFLSRQQYNFYGATLVQRDALTVVVVTLATRYAEIEELPRRLDGAARLRGRLIGGFSSPELAVAPPLGEVIRVPAGSGTEIDAEIPMTEPGTYKVEILAHGTRGDTVIANFPVYVRANPPNQITLQTSGGEDDDSDAAAVARTLFRQINQTRAQNGLPPLQSHEGLANVSRAHSQDMVDNNFVGHTSPTTGSAPERVRGAGYRSGLILENIGRGYSSSEIHRGLLASPGHAANILNRDVTHVGVGVVSESEGSREAFVATEVFIRMNREIDAGAAAQQLLEAINEGRRARGADPLELDPNLTEAAQGGADAYFENPTQSQQDTVDDASAQLRRFAVMFRRVGGLMSVVGTINEASRLEPTFDPDVRYVGIGVRQGDRPDAPPNSIAVVIMLAWPR